MGGRQGPDLNWEEEQPESSCPGKVENKDSPGRQVWLLCLLEAPLPRGSSGPRIPETEETLKLLEACSCLIGSKRPCSGIPDRRSSGPCVNVLHTRALYYSTLSVPWPSPSTSWRWGFWDFDPALLVPFPCAGRFERLSYALYPPRPRPTALNFPRLNTLTVPHRTRFPDPSPFCP